MRGVVFSRGMRRPATWLAGRPGQGVNPSRSVRNGPCAARYLTTPTFPAAVSGRRFQPARTWSRCRGVTSASRAAPAAASSRKMSRSSANSGYRPVSFIGRAVPDSWLTAMPRLSRECRYSLTVRACPGSAMVVKSILVILAVRGRNPLTSHTSSANRGPSSWCPARIAAGSTGASAAQAGPACSPARRAGRTGCGSPARAGTVQARRWRR